MYNIFENVVCPVVTSLKFVFLVKWLQPDLPYQYFTASPQCKAGRSTLAFSNRKRQEHNGL